MNISVKMPSDYPNCSQNEQALRMLIEKSLNLSNEQIETAYNVWKSQIGTSDLWSEVCNEMNGAVDIRSKDTFAEFLMHGAVEIVNTIQSIRLKDLALYRLMNEGYLMPIMNQFGMINVAFNVNCCGCSITIKVAIDALQYERFMVVKKDE